jgi:hypothetical protein
MMLGPDGNSFTIAANDASVYYQLQRTNALQHKGPVHQYLDDAAGRQQLIGFEQDATAANVQCLAESKVFHSTFPEQLVFNFE